MGNCLVRFSPRLRNLNKQYGTVSLSVNYLRKSTIWIYRGYFFTNKHNWCLSIWLTLKSRRIESYSDVLSCVFHVCLSITQLWHRPPVVLNLPLSILCWCAKACIPCIPSGFVVRLRKWLSALVSSSCGVCGESHVHDPPLNPDLHCMFSL